MDQFTLPPARFPAIRHTVLQFPAGNGPSQEAVADFNGDSIPDVAVTDTGSNVVSVCLANGDGTFASPRQFAVGAFRLPNPVGDDANLNTYRRDVVAADFNADDKIDLAVTNYDSADVSVLLGRGDGTFQTQQRFDAAAFPFGLAAGDVNGDGHIDLVVVDSPEINVPNKLAVLLGRGDGTFLPQKLHELPNILFLAVVALADLNHDGKLDLIVGGGINDGIDVLRGGGDGSFTFFGHFAGTRQATDIVTGDFNGDGNVDVIATSLSEDNAVVLIPGDGALGFVDPQVFSDVGQGPLAVNVADWGSAVDGPDGITLGPPDGQLDLIVANSGVIPGPSIPIGPPGIVVLPAIADEQGNYTTFGEAVTLTSAQQPLDLDVRDYNADGALDIAVVDRGGFFIIFGHQPVIQPNTTREAARNLGTVVHLVEPTLTITPQNEDAWFRMRVPTEVVSGAGDEVLDFLSGFEHQSDAGLKMEVVDSAGTRRGSGDRFRIVARQGETLFVHVFGVADNSGLRGSGAYTLIIDTLPQVVGVEAPTLLPGQGGAPGGPTSSLVVVLQGDRLNRATAEDPTNYRVTWLGSDGMAATGDERTFVVGAGLNAERAAVYDASSNVDISSGRTTPTAVRQTVTLLFGQELPSGNYIVDLAPQIQTEAFNEDEAKLLSRNTGFTSHPVVSLVGGQPLEGASFKAINLVRAAGAITDLREFESGTRFLTQFHDDLGALLDALLSKLALLNNENNRDDGIMDRLLNQVVARFEPALGPVGQRPLTMVIMVLDPVPFSLTGSGGRADYDTQGNAVASSFQRTYVEVGQNVEVVVIAGPSSDLNLTVGSAPPLARGGYVVLGVGNQIQSITHELRTGLRSFEIKVGALGLTPLPSIPDVRLFSTVVNTTAIAPANLLVRSPQRLDTAKTEVTGPGNQPVAQPGGSGGGDKPAPSLLDQIRELLQWIQDQFRRRILRLRMMFQGLSNLKREQSLVPVVVRRIDNAPRSDPQGQTIANLAGQPQAMAQNAPLPIREKLAQAPLAARVDFPAPPEEVAVALPPARPATAERQANGPGQATAGSR